MSRPINPPSPETSQTLDTARSALSSVQTLASNHKFTYHEHALAIQTPDEPAQTPKTSKSRSRLRTSDASEVEALQHTPGSLTADVSYYKELFSKLRFSYLESVTKEKYLREIIDDPPVVYENHENEELENDLAGYKKELGEVKLEMASLIEQIETVAAKLGPESETVNKKLTELEKIPSELQELDTAITSELEKAGKFPNHEPYDESLHLPLDETMAIIRGLELELSTIDRDLTSLKNSEIPRKQRLTEQLDKDLKPLEMEQADLVGQATQAREMREKEREMGRADRENMGRWFKATNEALQQLVGP